MALVNGTVSVSNAGVVTGAGFARALYDALVAIGGVELAKTQADSLAGAPGAATFATGAVEAAKRCAVTANALAGVLNAQTKTATVAVAGITSGPSAAVGTVT